MNDERGVPVSLQSACVVRRGFWGRAVLLSLILFIFVPPSGSCGECVTNDDCPAGSYCKKVDGNCEGVGICEGKPEVCIALVDPVCGCDGSTYASFCEAARAGVSLMHMGKCEGDEAVSLRGSIFDRRDPWPDTLYVNLDNCKGLSQAVEDLENGWVTIEIGTFYMEIPGEDFGLTRTGNFVYYVPGKRAGEETIRVSLLPVSDRVYFYCGNTRLNGIVNPITVTLTIGEWSWWVTREWQELPYSAGTKYRAN